MQDTSTERRALDIINDAFGELARGQVEALVLAAAAHILAREGDLGATFDVGKATRAERCRQAAEWLRVLDRENCEADRSASIVEMF